MRLRVKLLDLAVIVSVILLLPSTGYATEEQWVKYSGNPVQVPTTSSWDSAFDARGSAERAVTLISLC